MVSKVNRQKIEMSVNIAKDFILNNFDQKRIECLILYGSALNCNDIVPNDIDLLLLLDTYNNDDLKKLIKISSEISIQLFIDYKDQILRKGLNNYQRGRHGTYFFIVLAFGRCILGKNFYLNNVDKLENRIVKRDLLFRIEEYFYRIQKHFINKTSQDIFFIKKYFSRIVFDLLFFYDIISHTNIHEVHYLNIFDIYLNRSKIFSRSLTKKLSRFVKGNNIDLVPEIVGEMYNVYLRAFDKYNENNNF